MAHMYLGTLSLFHCSFHFPPVVGCGRHYPVSRGFERASARRHRKRYVSHFPAYSHFSTFCVLFPEAAFLSPIVVGTFHAHSSASATDSTTLHFAAPRVIHEWYDDVCPLMLALLALEFLLSGISGVRLGSVDRKFVGRELQGCVDSFCPCGPDAVLVALGCVVMPKCLVRQRIHALPYLAAYCSVSALPEKYKHFFDFLGNDFVSPTVDTLSCVSLRRLLRISQIFYVKVDSTCLSRTVFYHPCVCFA